MSLGWNHIKLSKDILYVSLKTTRYPSGGKKKSLFSLIINDATLFFHIGSFVYKKISIKLDQI